MASYPKLRAEVDRLTAENERLREVETAYHAAREAVWTLIDIFDIDTEGG